MPQVSARELKWIRNKYSRMTDDELLQVRKENIIPEANEILASELLSRGWDDQQKIEARRRELEKQDQMARSIEPSQRSASKLPLIFVFCALAVPLITGGVFGSKVLNKAYFQCGVLEGCDGPRSGIEYYLETLLGYDLAKTTAHALSITNPTPFMITVGFLVIAWIAKRRDRRHEEGEEVAETLTALNRCDGCKAMFPNFNHLTKVDGKGFLCEKCQSEVTDV